MAISLDRDYWFKVGDTRSPLEATLTDADRNPVDISQATAITFSMRAVKATTAKISEAAAVKLDDGTPENRGKVRYVWQSADVDTAGDFYGEFTVSFAGGAQDTYPRGLKKYLLIQGQERLA